MKNLIYILIFSTTIMILGSCNSMFRVIDYLPSTEIIPIEFSNAEQNPKYEFHYSTENDYLEEQYLTQLRTEYGLDTLVAGSKNQLEKVKRILNWTNKQWDHDGNNQPKKRDAISILEEVKEGKSFRCVEYGIVSSTALNSVGIPSRVIGLKTRDVEEVKYAAGHVGGEAFLSDLKKWIFFDAQLNFIPVLNDIPLNAVEFQRAIIENRRDIKLVNLQGEDNTEYDKESCLDFIGKHLFYFDIMFDNRIESTFKSFGVNGNHKLTLVPLGHKEPKIFQQIYPIHSEYTNSLKDFYREP